LAPRFPCVNFSDFPLYNSCKTTFFKIWSSNYTSVNNNKTIINHNWWSIFHTSINCLPVFGQSCQSPMLQFAIFFLDWQLKSASGDFLAPRFPCVNL
jgi:hypothetical protein